MLSAPCGQGDVARHISLRGSASAALQRSGAGVRASSASSASLRAFCADTGVGRNRLMAAMRCFASQSEHGNCAAVPSAPTPKNAQIPRASAEAPTN